MSDKKDELDALQRRVAELERAAKPEPYITDWVVPPPAIDRVSMSPSAMLEMAQAVPDDVVRGIARDARAPQAPCSQGPPSATVSNVRAPVGTGWREASPLSNPPGINYADRLMDDQDAKDREALILREAQRRALFATEKPK